MNKKLSLIGFGHMGGAIAAGAVASGICSPKNISVADSNPAAAERAKALGLNVVSAKEAASSASILILAVKPSNLEELSDEIKGEIRPETVVVSICAGKKLGFIVPLFGRKAVRVMPNTPALVGEGMSALCKRSDVTDAELSDVERIFASFGKTAVLPEELFDAVTAVSGSGPAYVYAFIIALAKYAESAGMTAEQGKIFAAQTVLGSAKMVLASDESPETLKRNICTPGGTTVEAVRILDARGFEEIIIDAAKACAARSEEMGR